jgi:hypothetical protein
MRTKHHFPLSTAAASLQAPHHTSPTHPPLHYCSSRALWLLASLMSFSQFRDTVWKEKDERGWQHVVPKFGVINQSMPYHDPEGHGWVYCVNVHHRKNCVYSIIKKDAVILSAHIYFICLQH